MNNAELIAALKGAGIQGYTGRLNLCWKAANALEAAEREIENVGERLSTAQKQVRSDTDALQRAHDKITELVNRIAAMEAEEVEVVCPSHWGPEGCACEVCGKDPKGPPGTFKARRAKP